MMKWLAALLILANIGIYLWSTGIEPPEPALLPPPPINLPAMRLVQEKAPAAKPAATPAPVAKLCLRIGPFMQAAEAEALSRELASLKLAHRKNVQGGRQIRRWRVYLGPYPDAGAMESRRVELKKLGVADQYVKRESDGRDILSLGLFSQSAIADRYVQELRIKGVHPLIRPEDFPLGSVIWIDLTDTEANARAAESLRAFRYPDARTALREAPCPAK
jgi:hypothetical protein